MKIWQHLSFTQSLNKNEQGWTGMLRQGLNKFNHKDGLFLADALLKQSKHSVSYPLNEKEQKKLKTHTVNRIDKGVEVSIPDNVDETLQLMSNFKHRKSVGRLKCRHYRRR